eukprot:m.146004 g.146004  ORF g.146004 m.146004 type:complete len:51 (+) comp30462_c0_seq2:124-276(+)
MLILSFWGLQALFRKLPVMVRSEYDVAMIGRLGGEARSTTRSGTSTGESS